MGAGDIPKLTKFRLIHPVGGGVSGTVYKARRLDEQDIVAVKVLTDPPGRGSRARAVQAAAARAARLDHPGAVRTLGYVRDGEHDCLVMEFAPGDGLGRALQRNVRFSPQRALGIVRDVALVLEAAGALGLHHGALHPDQILLEAAGDDDEPRVRVLGIGVGQILPDRYDGPITDGKFNPLLYTAPEIFRRGLPSTRADIASLGLILYHLLTGYPPYRGTQLAELQQHRAEGRLQWPRGGAASVGEPPVLLVEHMSAADPAGRPNDFSELLGVIDICRRGRTPVAPRLAAPGNAPAPSARTVVEDAELPLVTETAPEAEAVTKRRPRRTRPWALTVATAAVFLLAVAVALQALVSSDEGSDDGGAPAPQAGAAPPAPSPTVSLPAPAPPLPQQQDPMIRIRPGSVDGRPGAATVRARSSEPAAKAEFAALLGVLKKKPDDPDVRAVVRERLLELARRYPDAEHGVLAQVEARRLAREPQPDPDTPAARHFAVVRRRAEGHVEAQRFQKAMDVYDEAIGVFEKMPDTADAGRWQKRALAAQARIRDEAAPAAYAQVAARAGTLLAAVQLADAKAVYEGAANRFGLEPWVGKARAQLDRISRMEELHSEQLRKELERARRDTARAKLPQLFRQVRADCYALHHKRAVERLDAMRGELDERELHRLLEDYAMAIKLEQWFFERAAKRIAGGARAIVIGRRDTRASFRIVELDGTGVRARSGAMADVAPNADTAGRPGAEMRVPWHIIPDMEILNLFKFAMDPDDGDEHLAMAVMALHRQEPEEHAAWMQSAVKIDRDVQAAARRYQDVFSEVERLVSPRRNRGPAASSEPRRRTRARDGD